ncbi:MAG: hypothetical protein SGJ00_07915 [bacterium]|nr:hypothetical protein [bacterium]
MKLRKICEKLFWFSPNPKNYFSNQHYYANKRDENGHIGLACLEARVKANVPMGQPTKVTEAERYPKPASIVNSIQNLDPYLV